MKTLTILGTGCPKCKKLSENAEAAARRLGIDYRMEKITDITKILEFGVMMTPALAVDGTVRVAGKVPPPEEIEKILASAGPPRRDGVETA
ncbi:MAG: thioredoxin family protein [Deltaproteobacteria bacterium]